MNKQRGFSLLEVLVAALIMAILSGMAFSSYEKSTMRGNRVDAKADLMDLTLRLQRCFTANGSYLDNPIGSCTLITSLQAGQPTTRNYYRVVATNVTATTYTLTATPIAGSRQVNDRTCAKMIIDQSGQRSALDNSDNPSTKCWDQ